MWNQKPAYPSQDRPASPEPPAEAPRVQASMAARISASPQPNVAMIGKSITITGDITGTEPLHVEGKVQGTIRLDGAYLNVGPDAVVKSNITAREVVVRGTVTGNVSVSERIDIRSGGSLTGDVTAHSVSIEEGAYFKGSIDMRRAEKQTTQPAKTATPKAAEPEMAHAALA
jgi:cytoskeletal protein CcmA (bactofilin family)